MAITGEMVKQLRQSTGAGVLDCRNALSECEGDFDKAAGLLRLKGLASAEKRATRSKVASLVELNCESDFVAMNDGFVELAHDIAMQVVASQPRWVRPEDVPADIMAIERDLYRQQALNEGKNEKFIERIVDGRLEKFYAQYCLLRQPFIRDQDVNVEDLLKQKIAQFGENIVVRRFVRMGVGEG
jgi:elongation factor Ts